jgi:uncharacterized membrane protein
MESESVESEASFLDGVDRERAWLAGFGALVVVLVGGSLLFPDRFYGGFVWQYFWGPVYADAHSATCAVWDGGARTLLGSAEACRAASGPVAYPGYTLVSEVGYAVTLLVMLSGLVLLLDRLDVGEEKGLFYALLPFMFFGGALRVVEDASDAVPQGADAAISYPWNALIISPIIYFTVFAVTMAVLVAGVWLARSGRADSYERPVFAGGAVVLAATIGYLVYLAVSTEYVAFHPVFPAVILTGATVAAGATWWLVERYEPEVNAGTGLVGLVVIWGHAIDGVANVVGLDWAQELGLRSDLVPKHPVNRAIVDFTAAYVPESITAVVGTAWGFLLVKLAVAVAVVWVFDEQILEESPRFSVLLLIAILAVGLGPGTRDMLRATFGV